MYKTLIYIAFLSFFTACGQRKSTEMVAETKVAHDEQKNYFDIEQPRHNDTIIHNQKLTVKVKPAENIIPDSVMVFVNNKLIYTGKELLISLGKNTERIGKIPVGIEIHYKGQKQRKTINVFVKPSEEPRNIKYRVIARYKHDNTHFTQGFIVHNGYLYEGTGQNGTSAIYKINYQSGAVLQSVNMPNEVFGEGITILSNKIIQLTYKNMEGYVYNLETFEKIRTFPYSVSTEGWGLTHNNQYLIMSNGSNNLMLLDTINYAKIDEVQIYDTHGEVNMLNELEYVDGFVYANIWMEERIAKIDLKSGMVVGYIDLSSIVPAEYKGAGDAVLNGIAYIPKNGNFLVTGKLWNVIYEIKLEN